MRIWVGDSRLDRPGATVASVCRWPLNKKGCGWNLGGSKKVVAACTISIMQTIRSFIAVPLSREVARAAVRLVEKLREPGDGIKWVPTDNLHLTLKFLGEVENVEVPRICDVIREVLESYEPFDLHFGGAGALPSMERARVICASIDDPSGSLKAIVGQLEVDLAELGFKQEPRDYVPNLTLGRTKGGSKRASEAVVERVRELAAGQLGTMPVDEVQLIGSFLDKKGPSYHVMDTIELG